ncbi:hypothetical protein AB1K70_10365 [Bremerella sp. JC770]|uniref:hypothetical protein n=1 Tax=Bremerella sp. JC770 TaxID=3232137 RepID=UPI003459F4DD
MIRYRSEPNQKWFGLFDPSVLISPVDQDQFLEAIQSARPDLAFDPAGNLVSKDP